MSDTIKNKQILITGGTSGLGLSLVMRFLRQGFSVYALGRADISKQINNPDFKFVKCDFTDLNDVREVGEHLIKTEVDFSFIINNAGILSPPDFQATIDGFELSYQVNFLSHVLLSDILLAGSSNKPECIVNVCSPLYVHGKIEMDQLINENNYSIVQAYAQSKLFMALFSEKLSADGHPAFCFNPGTFSSGIYRMQKNWFHNMYKIAAPFMISSERVAKGLVQIMETNRWSEGKMINRKGLINDLKAYSYSHKEDFWDSVASQLSTYEI